MATEAEHFISEYEAEVMARETAKFRMTREDARRFACFNKRVDIDYVPVTMVPMRPLPFDFPNTPDIVAENVMEPDDADGREGLRLLRECFADATVEDMVPPMDLNVTSLEHAKRLVGEPGILFAAESLGEVVRAIQLGDGGLGCDFCLVQDDLLGSPFAWALISKDGKRAVVGMRDGR
jgi:hypothetical protein